MSEKGSLGRWFSMREGDSGVLETFIYVRHLGSGLGLVFALGLGLALGECMRGKGEG
jgi:hypothetical protein